MQFFMGLNDEYDNTRNSILIMNPLPPLNQAFSMALSVEKQREIHHHPIESTESTAIMLSQTRPSTTNSFYRGNQRENHYQNKSKDSKDDRYCTYCKNPGHTKANCFKLIRYPDWFLEKQKNKQKKGNNTAIHNMATSESPLDISISSPPQDTISPHLSKFIQQEVSRVVKGKASTSDSGISDASTNFVHFSGYAD
ncbi:uncharacterized protein LOC105637175 isoform X2 [Jatropha curcas]|uniref:uncharacterized protein LOC105637175 isoform X2 n=1 Tax=Jatropha curcas TaxID=180498 RepID=UPI00189590C7|nr:uncharacterized protein LOC105637175 isoform X2 [Jatropha curcas]